MKWSIRESVDVYFKALSTFKLGARTIRKDEPILIFDSVKTSTLEVSAEMSYVTGGRGNARLLSFEGDKVTSFSFEDALLSAEGLAILAGAELIPARNKNLPGASPDAKSVISHYTETYSVETTDIADNDATNLYEYRASLNAPPRGGQDNIWLSRKPYIGQNASIHIILQDQAGEMSGSPIAINLKNTFEKDGESDTVNNRYSYIRKFKNEDKFIAFDSSGNPMKLEDFSIAYSSENSQIQTDSENIFDDLVAHYVTANDEDDLYWASSWGDKELYIRTIGEVVGEEKGTISKPMYSYLIGQPKAFKPNVKIVYKVNCPSILYQDIVLIDYYVEYQHNATQISILPDKFAPYVYVEGSSLVRRASDGKDLPCEFVIPKLKITTALTFTLTGSGDASTFNFQGDAYPAFSKFDLTRKVLADIQILDADDNYDSGEGEDDGHPTSYRRFRYNIDGDGEYVWKDPSIEQHSNIDVSDAPDYDTSFGGPATLTPGRGILDKYMGTITLTAVQASFPERGGKLILRADGEVNIYDNETGELLEIIAFGGVDKNREFDLSNRPKTLRITGEVTYLKIDNAELQSVTSMMATLITDLILDNSDDSLSARCNILDVANMVNLRNLTLNKIAGLTSSTLNNANLEDITMTACPDLKVVAMNNIKSLIRADFQNSVNLIEVNLPMKDNSPNLNEVLLNNTKLGNYGDDHPGEVEETIALYKPLIEVLPLRSKDNPGKLDVGSEATSKAISVYKEHLDDYYWTLIPDYVSNFNLLISIDWTQGEPDWEGTLGVRGDTASGELISISIDEDPGHQKMEITPNEWEEEGQINHFALIDTKSFDYAQINDKYTIRVEGRITGLYSSELPITNIDEDDGKLSLAQEKIFIDIDIDNSALTVLDLSKWMNSLQDIRITENDNLHTIDLD